MEESIFKSVKDALSIQADDTSFDTDILMYINSAFANLQQLGVGPVDGFVIADATPKWSDYLGTLKALNMVQTYVIYSVKQDFDPPGTPHHMTAVAERIKEPGWRLNMVVDTGPPSVDGDVLDAGVL